MAFCLEEFWAVTLEWLFALFVALLGFYQLWVDRRNPSRVDVKPVNRFLHQAVVWNRCWVIPGRVLQSIRQLKQDSPPNPAAFICSYHILLSTSTCIGFWSITFYLVWIILKSGYTTIMRGPGDIDTKLASIKRALFSAWVVTCASDVVGTVGRLSTSLVGWSCVMNGGIVISLLCIIPLTLITLWKLRRQASESDRVSTSTEKVMPQLRPFFIASGISMTLMFIIFLTCLLDFLAVLKRFDDSDDLIVWQSECTGLSSLNVALLTALGYNIVGLGVLLSTWTKQDSAVVSPATPAIANVATSPGPGKASSLAFASPPPLPAVAIAVSSSG